MLIYKEILKIVFKKNDGTKLLFFYHLAKILSVALKYNQNKEYYFIVFSFIGFCAVPQSHTTLT